MAQALARGLSQAGGEQRARLAVALFSAFGLVGLAFIGGDWLAAIPLVVFYAVLVCNTYFSVRCFAPLTPSGWLQSTIDAVLLVGYAVLAASFIRPLAFTLAAAALFGVATTKYAVIMRDIFNVPELLRRKIRVNAAGTLACLAAVGGEAAGYATAASVLLAACFIVANVYLLLISPLYVSPLERTRRPET